MHIVVMTEGEDVAARFDAEAPPRIGDRIEVVPLDHPPAWQNYEVRAVRWVAHRRRGTDDDPTPEEADVDFVAVDVMEVVRTDRLPYPWNVSGP